MKRHSTAQNVEIKFQDKGWGLIIYLLQHFSTKAFPRKSCHKSENDTSHLVFNVKQKTRQKVININ